MIMRPTWENVSAGLDVEGLRRGLYADPPYLNIVAILSELASQHFQVEVRPSLHSEGKSDGRALDVGDVIVETHWIVRRQPFTVIAGVARALAILREATGYFQDDAFVSTAESLEVDALEDGDVLHYDGLPIHAQSVLIVRGRYRDFALLKTAILGTLSRASRIATNVYEALQAANGKPVYFFSARYDPHEVQAADGYAYHVAVQTFNRATGASLPDAVSTYANAQWWGGEIEGTISHEAIACFLGDAAELMVKFAEVLPPNRIRVALVDFHNDCVADTKHVLLAMFNRYKYYVDCGDLTSAARYRLQGIRVDTSKELLDKSLLPSNDPADFGTSPRLIRLLRKTIDEEWQSWDLPEPWKPLAKQWCQEVRIMASGGFSASRIHSFEQEGIPVDFYGVGSALLSNCPETGTTTDFSSIVAKVKVGDSWVDTSKVGRQPNPNPALKHVNL